MEKNKLGLAQGVGLVGKTQDLQDCQQGLRPPAKASLINESWVRSQMGSQIRSRIG